MFKFEFKKVIKLKYPIIIILILAFTLSLNELSIINKWHLIDNKNVKNVYERSSYLSYLVDNIYSLNLSEEDKKALERIELAEGLNFLDGTYNKADEAKDEEEKLLIFREATFEYANRQKEIIDKFGIEVPEEMQKDMDWNDFEEEIIRKNNTFLFDSPSSLYAINPFRVLIESSNSLFSIIPILAIVIISISMVGEEKLNGSLFFSKFQPIRTRDVVLSKLLVGLVLAILYSIFAIAFSLILSRKAGYPWLNGHLEVYRIFTEDGSFKYYLAYELLIRIVLYFLMMFMFFESLALLISTKVKNHFSEIFVISTILLILYVLTNSFESFRLAFNPVYSLNIKNNILGYIEYSKSKNYLEEIYIVNNGYIQYYVYLILSIVFLFLSEKNWWTVREGQRGRGRVQNPILDLKLKSLQKLLVLK